MCDLLALNRHLWQICDLTALIEHLPNSCVTYLHSMNHCLIWSIMVSLISGPSVSLIFSLIVPRACWYSFSWFPCVMRLVASVFRAKAWGVFLILVGKGGGAYVTKMFGNWTYIVFLLFSLQPYFYLPGNTLICNVKCFSISLFLSLPPSLSHSLMFSFFLSHSLMFSFSLSLFLSLIKPKHTYYQNPWYNIPISFFTMYNQW